jgi:hypothetical protein
MTLYQHVLYNSERSFLKLVVPNFVLFAICYRNKKRKLHINAANLTINYRPYSTVYKTVTLSVPHYIC